MGHVDIVSLLLHRGCDPNATTMRGETSLHLAARGIQSEVMKLLLRNGAAVDARAKVLYCHYHHHHRYHLWSLVRDSTESRCR